VVVHPRFHWVRSDNGGFCAVECKLRLKITTEFRYAQRTFKKAEDDGSESPKLRVYRWKKRVMDNLEKRTLLRCFRRVFCAISDLNCLSNLSLRRDL
jgi:hypothetical protein